MWLHILLWGEARFNLVRLSIHMILTIKARWTLDRLIGMIYIYILVLQNLNVILAWRPVRNPKLEFYSDKIYTLYGKSDQIPFPATPRQLTKVPLRSSGHDNSIISCSKQDLWRRVKMSVAMLCGCQLDIFKAHITINHSFDTGFIVTVIPNRCKRLWGRWNFKWLKSETYSWTTSAQGDDILTG